MTRLSISEGVSPDRVARRISSTLAVATVLLALVSFAGWVANLARLADWDGDGIAMQPNPAVAAMVTGLALLLLNAGWRRVTMVFGAFVAAIGAVTIFQHVTGMDLGVDALLLYGREWGRRGTLTPGRMGPPSSLSWFLLGIGLILSAGGPRARRIAPALPMFVTFLMALSLVGYFLGVDPLYALPRLTAISMQASTITLIAALAMLAALVDRQPMRRLVEDSAAGLFMRRTLPMILTLPLLLAWLRLVGERAQWYDTAMGVALFTLLLMVLLAIVMWRGATAVARHEHSLLAAHEASARADMVLRTASDQFALLDAEWRYIYVNDRVVQDTGIHREDMIGRTFWEVWPTMAGTSLETAARRVMDRRLPESLEYHHTPWDRWFDIRLHPTPDGGVAMLLLEVTARRHAEEALRMREQQLRLVTDAVPALISYVDRKERYRFLNKECESWFGVPRERMIGKTMAEVQGEAAMERLRPYVDRALQGERVRFEMETAYQPGHSRWIDGHYVPDHDAEGRVMGFFVLVLDITEQRHAQVALRESEAHLSAILAQLPVGVGFMDMEGRVVLSNRLMREYVPERIPSRDPARRDRWESLLPDGSPLPPSEWPRERALRGEDVSEGIEFSYRNAEGDERWTLVSAVPFRDAEDAVVGVISVVQDITARKRDERILRASEERLREVDRVKDEFLATLAHELRNPLAPLVHSLEILKVASANRALAEQARATMERQVTHMVRLVDDLLDVSRITRNALELRRARVALGPIIQHAVEACRSLIEGGRHTLTVEVPAEPLMLDADQVRLTQVFGNLLTNACRYTEPGGRIHLQVRPGEGEVLVSVKDDGVGIPPEMLDQIFQMFTQVDRPLERVHGGLGVGLTLVKRLVELHGGSVSARSDGVGRGSAFTVRLPLATDAPGVRNTAGGPDARSAPTIVTPRFPVPAFAKSDAAAAGAPVTDIPEGRAEIAPTSVRRILVADDNPDAAESLVALLRLAGYTTEVAADGAEAVEKAAAFRPDTILLDIGLPKMNGYDACRAIRAESWGRLPLIIAVTGWGQEQDRRRSVEAGFDGHLIKPVEYATLMRMLASVEPAAPVG